MIRASRSRSPLGWAQFAVMFTVFALLLVLLLLLFPSTAQ
jgi:hypothetical protein